MQITYNIWKVKDAYEKVLKEVTYNLWEVLNKSVKSIEKVRQALESVRKSPAAENPHHAETRQSIRNVATKREPKTRGDFKTDQSTINTCNFHNIN